MLELHNHAKSLGNLFSPDAMSKERQLYHLQGSSWLKNLGRSDFSLQEK